MSKVTAVDDESTTTKIEQEQPVRHETKFGKFIHPRGQRQVSRSEETNKSLSFCDSARNDEKLGPVMVR